MPDKKPGRPPDALLDLSGLTGDELDHAIDDFVETLAGAKQPPAGARERTLRDQVIRLLEVTAAEAPPEAIAGHQVSRWLIPVELWTGDRYDSLGDDCRKRGALVADAQGHLSCLEVEVVRRLRTRWASGWVQGFPCGGRLWSEWIWKSLPLTVAALNERIQAARGLRSSSHAGHPDIAVTNGLEVVYIECKMLDDLKASQIDWFGTAFRHGILAPPQVLVVQGKWHSNPIRGVR